jgi:hypothetical protein
MILFSNPNKIFFENGKRKCKRRIIWIPEEEWIRIIYYLFISVPIKNGLGNNH